MLLADDNYSVRRLCQRALECLEIEVVEASSGEEAIELWEEAGRGFSMALLDLCMPGATGIQVLHYLRQTAPELPVVLMTATGFPGECSRLSNVTCLSKPFRVETLRRLVRDVIDLD